MVRLSRAVSVQFSHRPSHLARVSRRFRRPLVLAGAVALALGVSACGLESRTAQPTTADASNLYVWAGPMTYQVQITRQLNPYSTEDSQYLAGIPTAQSLPPDQMWFGVFLWAKNQSGRTAVTANNFTITDSLGTVYRPVPLNPVINQYAWSPQKLPPDATEPAPDSTAAYGPTQGGLVLFKLSTAVYSNRPLTLNIYAPGHLKPTTVSLDL